MKDNLKDILPRSYSFSLRRNHIPSTCLHSSLNCTQEIFHLNSQVNLRSKLVTVRRKLCRKCSYSLFDGLCLILFTSKLNDTILHPPKSAFKQHLPHFVRDYTTLIVPSPYSSSKSQEAKSGLFRLKFSCL